MRVLLSRPREEAAPFIRELDGTGIEVLPCRLIAFESVTQAEAEAAAKAARARADFLLFTSARAVTFFLERVSLAAWANATPICAGEKTAAAARREGFPVSLAAPAGGQEAVKELFGGGSGRAGRDDVPAGGGTLAGKVVVLPRSAAADSSLPEWLAEQGAEVIDWPLYRPVTDRSKETMRAISEVRRRPPAALAFTSPSTVSAFAELIGGGGQGSAGGPEADGERERAGAAGTLRFAIGETTAAALRTELGGVDHVAVEHTLEGLAHAVRIALRERSA